MLNAAERTTAEDNRDLLRSGGPMFILCTRSHDAWPTVVITDGSMLSPVPSRAHGLNEVEIPHNALGVRACHRHQVVLRAGGDTSSILAWKQNNSF